MPLLLYWPLEVELAPRRPVGSIADLQSALSKLKDGDYISLLVYAKTTKPTEAAATGTAAEALLRVQFQRGAQQERHRAAEEFFKTVFHNLPLHEGFQEMLKLVAQASATAASAAEAAGAAARRRALLRRVVLRALLERAVLRQTDAATATAANAREAVLNPALT